jgi:uncharacterized protein YdaU (DUF1376 family)
MSMSWFPLYHGDYLRDTMSLNAEEHGVYLLLLMAFFAGGPLRDDIDELALIARTTKIEVLRKILTRYWELTGDGWVNGRMAEIKAKQEEKTLARQGAGRKGGLARASNARNLLEANAKQESSSGLCLTNAQASTRTRTRHTDNVLEGGAKKFAPPTPQEVAEYARSIGYLLDGTRFVDHYTANGWRVGRTPMKDWRAAVRLWKTRDKENSHAPRHPPAADRHRNAVAIADAYAERALAAELESSLRRADAEPVSPSLDGTVDNVGRVRTAAR